MYRYIAPQILLISIHVTIPKNAKYLSAKKVTKTETPPFK
jgi:hypothetical protein